MELNMMTDIERRNATDGKCHNTLTSDRECDAPAEWLGVTRLGYAYGFCDACKCHGIDAHKMHDWRLYSSAY